MNNKNAKVLSAPLAAEDFSLLTRHVRRCVNHEIVFVLFFVVQ